MMPTACGMSSCCVSEVRKSSSETFLGGTCVLGFLVCCLVLSLALRFEGLLMVRGEFVFRRACFVCGVG
jgi:hypothetical protein